MTTAQAFGFSLILLMVLMLVVVAGCGDPVSSISKPDIAGVEWQWSQLIETSQPASRWCPIRKTAHWSSSQMA
jgi:putative hemolysin